VVTIRNHLPIRNCFYSAGELKSRPIEKVMRTIALVSCGKSKRSVSAPACQLYTGDLFQKSLAYARKRNADAIYILSALHGLVELEQIIAPYEKTLNRMPTREINQWAECVLIALRSRTDLSADRFIILAGLPYRSRLIPHLANVELPLEGLGFGEQLKFLKSANHE
jgi:hypothetical protein